MKTITVHLTDDDYHYFKEYCDRFNKVSPANALWEYVHSRANETKEYELKQLKRGNKNE